MRPILYASGSFLDDLINWNWDFSPIWQWIRDTAHYWLAAHGMVTWIFIVAVILGLMLAFQVTNGIATAIINGLIKLATLVAMTVFVTFGWTVLKFIGHQAIARFRDAVRYIQVLRQPPAER